MHARVRLPRYLLTVLLFFRLHFLSSSLFNPFRSPLNALSSIHISLFDFVKIIPQFVIYAINESHLYKQNFNIAYILHSKFLLIILVHVFEDYCSHIHIKRHCFNTVKNHHLRHLENIDTKKLIYYIDYRKLLKKKKKICSRIFHTFQK